MKVGLSKGAESDLEAIGDYIARDNPIRALTFVRELRLRCLGLGEFPERFPLVKQFEPLKIHRCLHGNYLIFYHIEPEQVVILHIIHGSSDYDSLFKKDGA